MASYEQHPTRKTWSVRFRIIDNGFEHNKRIGGFRTKKEAEQAYHDFMIDRKLKQADKTVTQSMLFSDLARLYSEDAKHHKLYLTWTQECLCINHDILPAFGMFQVADITPYMVQNWVNGLQGKPSTIIMKFKTAKRIFDFGTRMFDTPHPATNTRIPKRIYQPDHAVWSPEQFKEFQQYLPNEKWKVYFEVLFVSGMRKGECSALTWDDISDNNISISKTIDENGTVHAPKTASSVRTVSMPSCTIKRLMSLPKTKNSNYIFQRSYYNRSILVMSRTIKKCPDLPYLSVHGLRHSCASYLIGQGFSIVAVSRRLGHSSPAMTMKVYAHMIQAEQDKLSSAFDDLF